MKDGFTIIWSFRNRLDIFMKSIVQADLTTPKDVDFCLVDASSSDITIRELRDFCNTIEDRTVRICESTYRSTLSEAWNLGMMLTDNRYVIFLSSDTIIHKDGWFESMKASLVAQGNEYVLMKNHSLFGFDKKAISKMGWFSEEYEIGPHFDVDFMIRASENGVKYANIPNNGFYTHGDVELNERFSKELADRLPMNSKINEDIFKAKWKSGWPGWSESAKPHPPNTIAQVKRAYPEIDPHPFYTRKNK